MNTKTQNKPVENKEGSLPAQQQQPAAGQEVAVYDPGQDAGAGLENVTSDEYAIPFVKILDPKSPQCKPPSAGGLPGAKGGTIINLSTNEIFDGPAGIDFIPVHRDHHFVEWIKKNEDGSGGGFVGVRPPDDALMLRLQTEQGKFGKLQTPEGHELADTYYIYGLIVQEGQGIPALIAFASTQIKKYKNFMTRVMGIQYAGPNGQVTPPMWAHLWHFSTVYESKGQNSWYGWRLALKEEPPIKARLKTTDPLYLQGRELYNSIKAGKVTVKHEERQPGEDADEIPM